MNPAADPASRQFKVSIKLDNADHFIRPGMYTKVSFVKERTEAKVAVPREAITRAKGKTTIAVIAADGTATIKDVVLGATNNTIFEVKQGLKPGDRVVTLSYSPIKDGQKVKLPGDKKSESGQRGQREVK
jgi:multidrug efflux pump subunit AcrA (membrane-fusion protein)